MCFVSILNYFHTYRECTGYLHLMDTMLSFHVKISDLKNCFWRLQNATDVFPHIALRVLWLDAIHVFSLHSQKKGFFNGSSEWPKVLPGTFCYLNQGKGSPNYARLWRTIKGSSFSCEEPLKVLHLFTCKEPLKVLHLFTREEPLKVLHRWRDVLKNH